MLNDPYKKNWLEDLRNLANHSEGNCYLLIDGAFKPGFHRHVANALPNAGLSLLFEALPSCSDKARDVSPFLLQYGDHDQSSLEIFQQCSGNPMVSFIQTVETLEQLTLRLAPWCIAYSDGQRFNFRFPDTRRLPDIFAVLHDDQKAHFSGPAKEWRYIDREGQWKGLAVDPSDEVALSTWPELDDSQFAKLVDASEPEEMIERISRRQFLLNELPSRLHAATAQALRVAQKERLDNDLQLDWCVLALKDLSHRTDEILATELKSWRLNVAGV
jgi:hypothetical protein